MARNLRIVSFIKTLDCAHNGNFARKVLLRRFDFFKPQAAQLNGTLENISVLIGELKMQQKNIAETKESIEDLEENTQELEAEITEAQEEIESLEASIAEMQTTMKEKLKALEEARIRLTEQQGRLKYLRGNH